MCVCVSVLDLNCFFQCQRLQLFVVLAAASVLAGELPVTCGAKCHFSKIPQVVRLFLFLSPSLSLSLSLLLSPCGGVRKKTHCKICWQHFSVAL